MISKFFNGALTVWVDVRALIFFRPGTRVYRNIDLDEFMGVDSSFEQWRDWRLNNEISYSFLLLDWVDFVTLKCFLIELILSLWSVVFDCMANRSPNRENADLYRCDQTINIWNQSINVIYQNIIQYSKIIKTQILA